MAADLPRMFGRYRLQTQLAQSARSRVYLAQDTALNRAVAIRVLNAAMPPERLPLLFREARAALRLKHASIVPVHDLGELGGHVFLAMEHVAGETLARLLARGPVWSVAARLALVDQICAALAAAHRVCVLHLDLRSTKVIVNGSRLAILGMGLARAFERAAQSPDGTGSVPTGYFAPEQLASEPTDHRTDVFLAASLAHELLSDTHGEVRDHLDALFQRALAPRPADRFQSAEELRAAFQAIRDGDVGADGGHPVDHAPKAMISPFADTEKALRPDIKVTGAAAESLGLSPLESNGPGDPASRIQRVRLCTTADAVVVPFGRTVVGRGLDAGLALMSRAASRQHAAITVTASQVTVEDLGSENGTQINGVPASGVCDVLHHDAVTFADLTFRVEITRADA